MLEGILATSVMSPDQRTLVPQEEISGEEATVERGAIEVVGAEVETEEAMAQTGAAVATEETEVVAAAMEETEVGVAMVETEVGVAMVGTEEAVMVGTEEAATGETEEAAMEETEEAATEETEVAATEETEVGAAMEETEEAMEAKWEEETTTEMISATDHTDDCFECSFVSDMIHSEIARVLPAAFLVASSWVVKLSDIWIFIWVGGLGQFFF